MDTIFWIILVAVILKIIIYVFAKNKGWYQDFSTGLQNIGVLIAIVFSIFSYQQSTESLKKTDESLTMTDISLKKTDTGLAYTKEGLDLTKSSLESSEKVSQQTLDYLGSISGSSHDVKSNLDAIASRISMLPNQVGDIEKSLSEINNLTKQIENRIEEQENKAPKLEIVESKCDTAGMFLQYLVRNTGDFRVSIDMIKVSIPNNVYMSELTIEGFGVAPYGNREFGTQFWLWYNTNIMVKGAEYLYKINFKYGKEHTYVNNFKFKIQFHYSTQNSLSDILRDSTEVCY